MNDITSIEDIELLVNSFYEKVVKSEIGFFFNDVANVHWEKHLPKMYQFWRSLLLADIKFYGNPMGAHFPINEKSPLQQQHFETWLRLWKSTVNELFAGETANAAINKAENIAKLMAYKMEMATKLDRFN